MKRQVPNARDLAPLLKFKKPVAVPARAAARRRR